MSTSRMSAGPSPKEEDGGTRWKTLSFLSRTSSTGSTRNKVIRPLGLPCEKAPRDANSFRPMQMGSGPTICLLSTSARPSSSVARPAFDLQVPGLVLASRAQVKECEIREVTRLVPFLHGTWPCAAQAAGPDQACANAHRRLKWHPESVSIATRRGTRVRVQQRDRLTVAPGTGAVIAIAEGEPLSRVPPARSSAVFARGIEARGRAPLRRGEEGSVRKNGACWLWLVLARLTGVGND